MKRYSFIMTIKPELKTEYIKAHNEIWPDMAKAMDRFFVKKNPSIIGAEIEEIEEAFHID